jgi:hypothetical protein
MPVYLAVARTQPPLSGSWGARLLTLVLLPGIENKNIHVPLSMSQSYHTPFHPPTAVVDISFFKIISRTYGTLDIFVTIIFSSFFFALFVLKIRVLLPGQRDCKRGGGHVVFVLPKGGRVMEVDISATSLLCAHRVNCTSTLTNVQKRHPLPLSSSLS